MTVSSHAIANAFISLAAEQGRKLTNMQIQKLVFLAHGYCLALCEKPLYYHNTHAWQWGPVIPKLYKALQKFGSGFVDSPLESEDTVDPSTKEYEIIKAVFKSYGKYTGSQLSSLTHQAGTPWSLTWENNKFGIIENKLIENHYRKLLEVS